MSLGHCVRPRSCMTTAAEASSSPAIAICSSGPSGLLPGRGAGIRAPCSPPRASFELRRGVIEHDLGRIRSALPDDFVFHDHRRTGGGRIEGGDDYVAWMAALFEQSPDAIIESMYEVATAEHGVLAIGHTIG